MTHKNNLSAKSLNGEKRQIDKDDVFSSDALIMGDIPASIRKQ